jgi:hypothetical protein
MLKTIQLKSNATGFESDQPIIGHGNKNAGEVYTVHQADAGSPIALLIRFNTHTHTHKLSSEIPILDDEPIHQRPDRTKSTAIGDRGRCHSP